MCFAANAIAGEDHYYEESEVQMTLDFPFDFYIAHLDNRFQIY